MKENKQNTQFIEWDVHNWSKALNFWQAGSQKNLPECKVLEIGGRDGGLSLWFAKQGANVVCSDLDGPTDKARQLHIEHNVHQQIRYEEVNALEIAYTNEFDIVTFKSVLGGVSREGAEGNVAIAIQQMHKALKPEGELLFAENLIASPLHQFFRKKFVRWGDSWNYLTKDCLQESMIEFESVELATAGFSGAFGRTEKQREILARTDTLLWDNLLPSSWHYICFGVCNK